MAACIGCTFWKTLSSWYRSRKKALHKPTCNTLRSRLIDLTNDGPQENGKLYFCRNVNLTSYEAVRRMIVSALSNSEEGCSPFHSFTSSVFSAPFGASAFQF